MEYVCRSDHQITGRMWRLCREAEEVHQDIDWIKELHPPLDKPRLFSLERHRLMDNPTEVYKNYYGIDRVDHQSFFPRLERSNIRDHSFKVRRVKFKRDLRSNFWFNTDWWVLLPPREMVEKI